MSGKQRARNYRFLPKKMWQAGVNAVKGFKSILKKKRGGRLKGLIRYRNNRVGTGLTSLPQIERRIRSTVKSSKLGFEAIPEYRLRAN